MLREILRHAYAFDGVQLAFEPVRMLFFFADHHLEDRRAAMITESMALFGRGVELGNRRLLALESKPEHLLWAFTHLDRVQPLDVGMTVEQQYS